MHLVAVELRTGRRTCPGSCAASAAASAGWRSFGCTSANSSPPSRASVSLARIAPRDPAGHRAQQLVAGRMAERVVDLLEAVEVEEKDRGHATFAAGTGQGLAEPVEQQGAVRQPGQRVVQGQPPDPLLGRLALGQVLEHRDLGDDLARRGAHRRGVDGGDAARPVAAFERDLPARPTSPRAIARASAWSKGKRPSRRSGGRRLRLDPGPRSDGRCRTGPARGGRDDQHARRQMLQHRLEEGRLAFDLLEQALPLGLGPAAVGEVVHEQAPAFVQELERPGDAPAAAARPSCCPAHVPSGGGRSAPGASIGLRLGQPLISGGELLGRPGGFGHRFLELGRQDHLGRPRHG